MSICLQIFFIKLFLQEFYYKRSSMGAVDPHLFSNGNWPTKANRSSLGAADPPPPLFSSGYWPTKAKK